MSTKLYLHFFHAYPFSGQIQVGLITFDISLNVSYSDLMPHVTELAELIAHELEVKTAQVKVKLVQYFDTPPI